MQEKKTTIFKTPDITRLQEVIINPRTKIYIAIGADPEEARSGIWHGRRQRENSFSLINNLPLNPPRGTY